MVEPVVRFLLTDPEGIYVDATLGLGGHAMSLLETSPALRLVGIDRDRAALDEARRRLSKFGGRVSFIHGNFSDIASHLGGRPCSGVLADLGLSSFQISDRSRGFSYMEDGPLDMSMGSGARPVAKLLAEAPASEIAGILRDYGEEKKSGAIAALIVKARENGALTTTSELRSIVGRTVPARFLIGSLSRVFQALRIWANDELENLRAFLPQAAALLTPGGRLAVLSYHSLEDRMVKNYFRQEEKGCICPPDFPECGCGRVSTLKVLTRRPVLAGPEEVDNNPRARSARLRVAERLQR
jgi:16S rRNA (cytosine1402-N4)-methyltransferase